MGHPSDVSYGMPFESLTPLDCSARVRILSGAIQALRFDEVCIALRTSPGIPRAGNLVFLRQGTSRPGLKRIRRDISPSARSALLFAWAWWTMLCKLSMLTSPSLTAAQIYQSQSLKVVVMGYSAEHYS